MQSGISVRQVTLPLSLGSVRSCSIDVTGPVSFLLKAIPVMPDCHGRLYSRLGSQVGCWSVETRLASFGIALLSFFWT